MSYIHNILLRSDEADKEQCTINPWSRRCSSTSKEENVFINIIGYHLSIRIPYIRLLGSILISQQTTYSSMTYVIDAPRHGGEITFTFTYTAFTFWSKYFDFTFIKMLSRKCGFIFIPVICIFSLCDVQKRCNNPKWGGLKS